MRINVLPYKYQVTASWDLGSDNSEAQAEAQEKYEMCEWSFHTRPDN